MNKKEQSGRPAPWIVLEHDHARKGGTPLQPPHSAVCSESSFFKHLFSPPPPKPQPPRRAQDVVPAPLRDVPLAFPSSGIRPRSSPKAHQFLERGRQNTACDFCRVKNGRRVAYENVPDVSVALQRGFRRPSSSTVTRFPRRRARRCSSVRHLAPSWSGLLAEPDRSCFA